MKHHEESIENMISYFKKNVDVIALFLIGSVATGTERADSDVDGVAIVSPEFYSQKEKVGMTCESIRNKCTYEGGYFDIHYLTKEALIDIAECGSEPMRNMLTCARTLYTQDPEIPEIASRVPVFQTSEAKEKQLRYYCTMKMSYTYFLEVCKPQGFARLHTIDRIIFCLYRLILLENQILFPSLRKLEITVEKCSNKPELIIEKCQKLMKSMSDEDALEIINSYESWTTYKHPDPKDFQFIANNFNDPYEV